jgi:uncharacterized protein (DUF924 family)
VDAQTILTFWFNELTPADWWRKSAQQDQNIRQRFLQVHADAHTGGLSSWRNTPNGRLSEIIVLDQFSRNIYRDDPRAFASDPLALELAQKTVKLGEDASLTPAEKSFMYLPYMHSESLDIHNQALHLFDQPGLENNLDFELKHKAIIDRFGRYPHRNKILGRTSTQQEIEFLDQPGSSF